MESQTISARLKAVMENVLAANPARQYPDWALNLVMTLRRTGNALVLDNMARHGTFGYNAALAKIIQAKLPLAFNTEEIQTSLIDHFLHLVNSGLVCFQDNSEHTFKAVAGQIVKRNDFSYAGITSWLLKSFGDVFMAVENEANKILTETEDNMPEDPAYKSEETEVFLQIRLEQEPVGGGTQVLTRRPAGENAQQRRLEKRRKLQVAN
ncbi:hypothetical protein C8R46DRAFT_1209494 [Mycena filopes]|nr:hypothetical protein C8R46DRAFT_1209494 [Mycena filopes]